MAGLQAPLSTLRPAPPPASAFTVRSDVAATRMTRGRRRSLLLQRRGLSPPTPCRSSRRTDATLYAPQKRGRYPLRPSGADKAFHPLYPTPLHGRAQACSLPPSSPGIRAAARPPAAEFDRAEILRDHLGAPGPGVFGLLETVLGILPARPFPAGTRHVLDTEPRRILDQRIIRRIGRNDRGGHLMRGHRRAAPGFDRRPPDRPTRTQLGAPFFHAHHPDRSSGCLGPCG